MADHQRHLHELTVQAAPVEEQEVIAQVLAVIRGDDHQGIVEHAAPAELLKEHPQPPIEIRNAIVIDIGGHPHVVVRESRLVERVPENEGLAVQA